jgi:hypothetical protein
MRANGRAPRPLRSVERDDRSWSQTRKTHGPLSGTLQGQTLDSTLGTMGTVGVGRGRRRSVMDSTDESEDLLIANPHAHYHNQVRLRADGSGAATARPLAIIEQSEAPAHRDGHSGDSANRTDPEPEVQRERSLSAALNRSGSPSSAVAMRLQQDNEDDAML